MELPWWSYLLLAVVALAPIVWMSIMAMRAKPAPPSFPCFGCRNETARFNPEFDCLSWCRKYKDYVRSRNGYIRWRREQNLTNGEGHCPKCPQGQKPKDTLPDQCMDCAMICAEARIIRQEVA